MLPLNRNWRFSRTTVEAGHARDFDESAFERVVVPHTNARLPWHGFSEKASQLVSLYRRRFRLPPEARGRHVFVDFEGVMTASTVWINGVRLGEYKGGYTPFSFELTKHLDFDGENVLAVEVVRAPYHKSVEEHSKLFRDLRDEHERRERPVGRAVVAVVAPCLREPVELVPPVLVVLLDRTRAPREQP